MLASALGSVALLLAALAAADHASALDGCAISVVHQGHGPARTLETWSGGGESLLFAGEGADLVIYDVINPTTPVQRGRIGLSGPVAHIAVRGNGNLVAVSDRRSAISLVNVTNRTQPALLGRYVVPEGRIPRGLTIAGNVLYAAIVPAGPAAIDISNPAAPTLLQQVVTPGTDFVFDIKVSGNRAYMADDIEGVTVWNITNPAAMTQIASHPSTGASHLFIDGTRAYVARRNLGYDILNITNPTPTLIGSVGVVGSYSHGALVNGRLVTATGAGGLRAFDISTPANPQLVSTISDQANVDGVAGLGNTAWVPTRLATTNGIRAYGYTNPASPNIQSNIAVGGASQRVHAADGRIYVPQSPRGLAVYGNSGEQRGALLGRYDAANVYAATASGNTAYVASTLDDVTTLRVLDVTNPAAITQVASLAVPAFIYQLAVHGNRLWAATPSGVRVYDISAPASPSLLATRDGVALAVLPTSTRIYVGTPSGIQVVDSATPALNLLGTYTTGEPVRDLALRGNFLHIADGDAVVRIVNVSNPAAITPTGTLDIFPGLATGLAIDGTRLYVAAGALWGTLIADIATPSAPVRTGNLPTPDSVLDVAFDNGALVAAEGDNGTRMHYCRESVFASGFE
jgi:hypothetical protein